jgi:hypothetical protein
VVPLHLIPGTAATPEVRYEIGGHGPLRCLLPIDLETKEIKLVLQKTKFGAGLETKEDIAYDSSSTRRNLETREEMKQLQMGKN